MKQNLNVIMLGDSLTAKANWKELLVQDNILNLGVDGDTTKDILNRLNVVIEIKPKIVFLMAGINDMTYSIGVEEIFTTYQQILQKLIANNIKVIVELTLYTTMLALNKKVMLFNQIVVDYCEQNSIEYIDLNPSFCNDENILKESLTTDGLHLGQNAYKAWAYKLLQGHYFHI